MEHSWDDLPDCKGDSDYDVDEALHDSASDHETAKSKRRLSRSASIPLRPPKKTRGMHSRKSASYEKKAKTIALYDSLPFQRPGRGVYMARCQRVAEAMKVHSKHTVSSWLSPSHRAKVEAAVGRPIADYAPSALCKIINKGGRGKKAAGRAVFHVLLNGRRGAKYPAAETQTILWCREQRKKGNKLTTRIMRVKMMQCTAHHYGEGTGFKASAGWVKRFMARYGLTWRRRNDNAKKSIESLTLPLAAFLSTLRKFRMRHSKPTDTKYGKFGLFNTFNVDQVPLPFASADPRTVEFIGTKRVWIKQPGSGLDKRQATLQLLIRPKGKQPKPTLLFRGQATPKRACDRRKREEEEKGYDEDVNVLWQAKAWADTVTCVEWARKCFKIFVDEDSNISEDEECLLLADSLRSQTKSTFTDAVKASVNARTLFGLKDGSHLWQPVDHHVGAAYHRKMDAYYVEWMASSDGELYDSSVPVSKRRQLMTQWAGRAYRQLEASRELAEEKRAADPIAPPSMFYAAFLRTGCLITADGSDDAEIRPHTSIAGALEEQFRSAVKKPSAIDISEPEPVEPIIADQDIARSEGEDSEDNDDDPAESDNDDGDREPVDNDMELEVEDEQELVRAAAAAARDNGPAELRDFNLAMRVARQDGFDMQPRFAGSASSNNVRRQQIYDADLAAWEKEMNKKANARVQDVIWNTAATKALEEEGQAQEGEEGGVNAPRRVSRRSRRNRVQ
jgi:hypothetical protein